ncbi:hypothetical protein HDU76_002406 [Blyttiomyces sp. JEL0837]|nr:hypothetical protein HDU76_002406 [Blyttiomyces sp. JEL0837]
MFVVNIPIFDIILGTLAAIHEIRRKNKFNDAFVDSFLDRTEAIETPVKSLQNCLTDASVYQPCLIKLLRTLEASKAILWQYVGQSKTIRLFKVVSYKDKFESLSMELDHGLLDLQLAVQTEVLVGQGQELLVVKEVGSTSVSVEDVLKAVEKLRVADAQETIYQCVQCGDDFTESANPEGACKYHPAMLYQSKSVWGPLQLPCCGYDVGNDFEPFPKEGCHRTRHSASHHNKFPYINRLGHIRTSLHDSEAWLNVYQADHHPSADGATISGHFGLLRSGKPAFWVYQGNVAVHMQPFDEVEIEAPTLLPDGLSPVGEVTAATTTLQDPINAAILRSAGSWGVQCVWIVKEGNVVGVRISAKSSTGVQENVSELHLKIDPLQAGDTKVIFDDNTTPVDIQHIAGRQFPSSSPTKNYREIPVDDLSKPTPVLPILESVGELPVRIKAMSGPKANPEGSHYTNDIFTMDLMLMPTAETGSKSAATPSAERMLILEMLRDRRINVDEAERLMKLTTGIAPGTAMSSVSTNDSDNSITIIQTRVEICTQYSGNYHQYTKDPSFEWVPASFVKAAFCGAGQSGAQYEALELIKMGPKDIFKVKVEARFEVTGKGRSWTNRAFISRVMTHPLALRVTFEDAVGLTQSLVMLHSNPPLKDLPLKDSNDYFFLCVDDVDDLSRMFVRISRPDGSQTNYSSVPTRDLFTFKATRGSSYSYDINVSTVRKWVFTARQKAAAETAAGTKPPVYFEMKIDTIDINGVTVVGIFDLATTGTYTVGSLVAMRIKIQLADDGKDWAQDTWVLPAGLFA